MSGENKTTRENKPQKKHKKHKAEKGKNNPDSVHGKNSKILVFDADKLKSEKQLEAEAEEKSKRYLYVSVLLVIGVFIGAVFFVKWYIYHNQSAVGFSYKYTYNGFNFSEYQGTWKTTAYRNSTTMYEIYSRHGPKELENISVTGNISQFRRYDIVYITFNPNEKSFGDVTMAAYELTTKLIPHFGITPIMACTENSTECAKANAPIITCNNTKRPVIFLSQTPGPKVAVKGNCAIISGKRDEDIVRAADRFMYGLYGIMH